MDSKRYLKVRHSRALALLYPGVKPRTLPESERVRLAKTFEERFHLLYPDEQEALRLLFGLDAEPPMTEQQVADLMDWEQEDLRKVVRCARARLFHPRHTSRRAS